MICKCGAMVKASVHRVEITRFECLAWGETLAYAIPGRCGPEPAGPGLGALEARTAQEFGTIEGRSKSVTSLCGNEPRSLAR
jgi:hypothetical protein